MTTFHFTGAVAWDVLGTSVRIAANNRSVSIIDPATLAIPTGLVQGGVAVTWITVDSRGRYAFECDAPSVVVDFGAGPWDLTADEVPGLAVLGATASADATAAAAAAAESAASAALSASYVGAGKNLFDVSAGQTDKFWNSAGSLVTLVSWTASGSIPVTAATQYTINNCRSVNYYNAAGTFISYTDNPTEAALTFTTPALTAFVKYNTTTAHAAASQMETGAAVTSYEPFGVKVQNLLAGAEYLTVLRTSLYTLTRASSGIKVYASGDDLLIRSAFDATRDILMPIMVNGQNVAGAETRTLLTTTSHPLVQLVSAAALDFDVWPTVRSSASAQSYHVPNDDNPPTLTTTGYIGGNHTPTAGSKVTMTAHGKTLADVGSLWSDGTRTYTLIQIIDADHVLVGNPYTTSAGRILPGSVAPAATLTHVSGATNTASITITGGSALADLPPISRDRTTSVALDGRPVSDGANIGRILTVVETFTVVSYKALIDWAQAHIGSDPFANLASMTGLARLSNTYKVMPATIIVFSTTTILETTSVTINVTQCSPLQVPSGGTMHEIIPGAGTIGGFDFRTLADVTTVGAQINIASTDLLVAADPVQRVQQWAYDSGAAKVWGIEVGLLPIMDGKAATRRTNGVDTRSWYVSTLKKNYPELVWGVLTSPGVTYSGAAYRRYLPPTAPAEQVITDGNRWWLTITRPDAVSTTPAVAHAPEIAGRALTTIGTTTVTPAKSYVTGEGVSYTNTAPGYLLAEAIIDSTV